MSSSWYGLGPKKQDFGQKSTKSRKITVFMRFSHLEVDLRSIGFKQIKSWSIFKSWFLFRENLALLNTAHIEIVEKYLIFGWKCNTNLFFSL